MYQNYDAALSKTIMFLRFPLIVSVVFIHAGLEGTLRFTTDSFRYTNRYIML